MVRKSFAGTVLAVLAAAVLAACGSEAGNTAGAGAPAGGQPASGGSTSTQQQPDHNEADMTFAKEMIPHHTGAVEMAKLVEGRTSNTALLDLAKRVQATQAPEIQQMTDWLGKWGAMPEMTGGASMPGMNGHSMPGAMGADDMTKLSKAKGAAFDRMWLDMMIKHHEGAIEMARTQLGKGSNPDTKSLAQKIIDAQQAEITEMKAMLGKQ
ncbi:DUF305 domain-containing protein [Kibdelosporangium aridum]|uniref:DUF305 domain-containing protein n=1 Tax=Kibdelosporangium aridum TaxID=2030 RepID=UPI00056245DB|nr:DUF305 domain-containing protein [Kibdelosporangium aridum]